MACLRVSGNMIVCGLRSFRKVACESCGKTASIQCDYPVKRKGKNATCDRWQCEGCATQVGENLHYCKPHAAMGPPKL